MKLKVFEGIPLGFIVLGFILAACSTEPAKSSSSSSASSNSQSSQVSSQSSSINTELPIGQFSIFVDGQLSATNQTNWHSFTASNGTTYYIEYMDMYDLSIYNTYTAALFAGLYRADKTTALTNQVGLSGYTFVCSNTEKTYIMVCGQSWWRCIGTYGVKVSPQ